MSMIRVEGAAEKQAGIYYEYDAAAAPIGEGGMGKVFVGECVSESSGERIPVALKLISSPTKDLIDRAMREASVQIDHPNLLRMYGFIPNMEYDSYQKNYIVRYYIVMERLVGVTLSSLVSGCFIDCSGKHIPYAQSLYERYCSDRKGTVVSIMTNILKGVGELHSRGFIHRDLDPSNVMITIDNEIKLIDYGICKPYALTASSGPKLTQVGALIGKVDYAAPEVITGDVANHNRTTDIYSLGIMLYQLYTGSLPFVGDNSQIMQAHLNQDIPLRNIDDTRIRKVVDKATRKDQASRYQNVSDMLADLENDPGTDGGEDGGVREPSHVIGWWVYLLGGILGLTIGAVLALMI